MRPKEIIKKRHIPAKIDERVVLETKALYKDMGYKFYNEFIEDALKLALRIIKTKEVGNE